VGLLVLVVSCYQAVQNVSVLLQLQSRVSLEMEVFSVHEFCVNAVVMFTHCYLLSQFYCRLQLKYLSPFSFGYFRAHSIQYAFSESMDIMRYTVKMEFFFFVRN
jgi:hypothetical protein